MQASPLYEVTLHSPEDIFFNAYIHAGLFELQHRGLVKLNYRLTDFSSYPAILPIIDFAHRDSWDAQASIDGLALYTVKHLPSGRVSRMGVDLNDAADMFSQAFLQKCDIVFKRHFQTKYVQQLDSVSQAKLYPMGLIYNARSLYEQHVRRLYLGKTLYDLRHIRVRKIIGRKGLRRHLLNPLAQIARAIKHHQAIRTIGEYERDCHTPTQPYVLFQTRTFFPEGNRKTNKAMLNEQRARLIRTLRAAFGDRFVGGLIPDAFAREHYPDCLTTAPTDLRGYTNLIKNAALVVYTQGIIESPAWKFAEYLASAKCIVAEPLTTELPRPLVSGQEVIFYNSEQDCVDQCARLLADSALMEQMSCHAQAYYRAEIEPSARVLQMLEKAVAGA
ncbi:MAG: glycosyltransferase [Chloroflexota bacterium]